MEEIQGAIRTYARKQLGGLTTLTFIHAEECYAVARHQGISLLIFVQSGKLSSVKMSWHTASAVAEELVQAA